MLNALKIAVLVPHRNDRPQFLANLRRMLDAQTLRPEVICEVDYAPLSSACDISQRYRKGYEFLCNRGFDFIALMEVDDWYSPDYLETVAKAWIEKGKPQIFGQSYTIYYHIFLRRWFTMNHRHRSSAMNTILVPDLVFHWPLDHDPYTDLHLWRHIPGMTWTPEKHICLGIKHGIGMVGGHNHNSRMDRYINPDNGLFEKTLDPESFKFYTHLYETIPHSPIPKPS